MNITTVVVAIISGSIVIGVAIGHAIERGIYWSKQKKRQDLDRATGDLDKMLSDFRTIAERVVSVKDRTNWLQIKNTQGKLIKQRQSKTRDLRTGQLAFDEFSKTMSKDFDGSRNWHFMVMENQLNHYFLSLHDLIKAIEEGKNLDKEYKRFYIGRVRRSLSTHEVLTLFYFCMEDNYFCKQLKYWVEKYHLFESWPFYLFDTDTIKESHLKFYDSSAFGKKRKFLPT